MWIILTVILFHIWFVQDPHKNLLLMKSKDKTHTTYSKLNQIYDATISFGTQIHSHGDF